MNEKLICPVNKRIFVIKKVLSKGDPYIESSMDFSNVSKIMMPPTDEVNECLVEVIAVFEPFEKDGKIVKCSVNVGDKVVLGKWGGTEVNICPSEINKNFSKEDGKVFSILEKEVLGVLRK